MKTLYDKLHPYKVRSHVLKELTKYHEAVLNILFMNTITSAHFEIIIRLDRVERNFKNYLRNHTDNGRDLTIHNVIETLNNLEF
jgi:hypothetical protein